jgi:hypothetical protein
MQTNAGGNMASAAVSAPFRKTPPPHPAIRRNAK